MKQRHNTDRTIATTAQVAATINNNNNNNNNSNTNGKIDCQGYNPNIPQGTQGKKIQTKTIFCVYLGGPIHHI